MTDNAKPGLDATTLAWIAIAISVLALVQVDGLGSRKP